jgi:hypothetical protein
MTNTSPDAITWTVDPEIQSYHLETGDRATSGPRTQLVARPVERLVFWSSVDAVVFRVATIGIQLEDGDVSVWLVRQTRSGTDYVRQSGHLLTDLAGLRRMGAENLAVRLDLEAGVLHSRHLAAQVDPFAGQAGEAPAMGQVQRDADWIDPMDLGEDMDEPATAAQRAAWSRSVVSVVAGEREAATAERIAKLERRAERAEASEDRVRGELAKALARIAALEAEIRAAHGVIDRQGARAVAPLPPFRAEFAEAAARFRRSTPVATHGQNSWENVHGMRTVASVQAGSTTETLDKIVDRINDATIAHLDAHSLATPPAPVVVPTPVTDVENALKIEGIDVPRHLTEETPEIRERAVPAADDPTRVHRVFGVLDHGQLRHAHGRHGQVVPVELVPAYVAAVREAGFPAPARRLEVLLDLKVQQDYLDRRDLGCPHGGNFSSDCPECARLRRDAREHRPTLEVDGR